MASSTHIERTLRGDPDAARDPLWAYGTAQWDHAIMVLAGSGLVLGLVLLRIVRRSGSISA